MGIKSTQNLTRNQLKRHIISKLENLDEFSDKALANLAEAVDEATGNPFTNYCAINTDQLKHDALMKLTLEERDALGL